MPKKGISTTLPEGYAALLAAAKDRVRRAHISAARRVNSELVLMYLELGQLILDRQADEGWGTGVLERLAEDLRAEFPGQRGFSRRNLHYCRRAASIFTGEEVQQLAALLPWGHVMVLVDKVDEDDLRIWYARQAVEHGWSRNVLEHHIGTQLHTRVDRSPTPTQIPVGPVDSDLVRDLVKDPYRLDFLELDAAHSERQLENAMAHRMTALLAELGPGFAFVGPPGPAPRRRIRLLPGPALLPPPAAQVRRRRAQDRQSHPRGDRQTRLLPGRRRRPVPPASPR